VTTEAEASTRRKRGSIRRMDASLQVRVSAGDDPSTGERIVLVEVVPIEKLGNERYERVAMNQAEKVRTRLLAEADSLKVARTKATLGVLLDRWLPKHELDPTTRMNYESQIRNYIQPNLGEVPLLLLVRDASERLETFYARLRRCCHLCSGKPLSRSTRPTGDTTAAWSSAKSMCASRTRHRASVKSTQFSAGRSALRCVGVGFLTTRCHR
jgi:integrase